MEFGDVLKQIRTQRGLSQDELAGLLNTSKQVISRYENKQRIPKISVLARYAEALNVSQSYLSGEDIVEPPAGLEPMPPLQRLPVIGSIACGVPILAEQNIEEYLSLPVDGLKADFILRCKGDSMIDARITDGDLAFIRIQPEVDHGEIAAVQIDDETATLKRFFKYPNQIVLMPANAAYEPMIFTGEEMARVRVVGKAVGFLSLFN